MSATLSAPELMKHLEQTLTISLSTVIIIWGDDPEDAEEYDDYRRTAGMFAASLDMELAIGPPEKHGDDWTFPIQPRGIRHLWPEPLRHGWSKTWDWKGDESDDLW